MSFKDKTDACYDIQKSVTGKNDTLQVFMTFWGLLSDAFKG